jgi:hypothetical protein
MIPISARGSLYNLLGPGAMSGLLFADLMDQMLILESATAHFKLTTPSDRAGDFAAVDAIAEVTEGHDLDGITGQIGFQYKFCPSETQPLSKSHKSNIQDSLKSVATAAHRPNCWILVTPEDFDKYQLKWLLDLKDKFQCDFEIRHWGQKRISALITKYPQCAVHLYPELGRGMKPLSFRDMCSRLERVLAIDNAHSIYHIDTRLTDGRTVRAALDIFLKSDESLFCLLGSYGTGKTNALEHLTLELARSCTQGQLGRVPFLIRLRGVRGSGSFAHNVVTYIDREYGLELDVTTLKTLNAAGRIVLILDGLDEKESQHDRRLTQTRLSEVFEFLAPTGKLILSSRTEFFKDTVEEWNLIFGRHRPNLLSTYRTDTIVSIDRRGILAYTAPLSSSLIQEYVFKRVGKESAPLLFSKMRMLYDISDITTRPVLLDMVCSVLPDLIGQQDKIFVTDLYAYYIKQQLEQDVISSRMSSEIEAKLWTIQNLAEKMIISSNNQIHHQDIMQQVPVPEGELDRDFLNTSFLVRDGLGNYEFSHRSFLEYFGAMRMFNCLRPPFDSSKQWLHPDLVSGQQYGFLDQFVAAEWEHRGASAAPGHGTEEAELIDASPVTFEDYSQFVEATGYSPIKTVENSCGYVKVCWYDAVAFVLSNRIGIPSSSQLVSFIHKQWPHSCMTEGETPRDSVFSCMGPDKLDIMTSGRGAIAVRSEREWSAMHTLVEMRWRSMSAGRALNEYERTGSSSIYEHAMFRCKRSARDTGKLQS